MSKIEEVLDRFEGVLGWLKTTEDKINWLKIMGFDVEESKED